MVTECPSLPGLSEQWTKFCSTNSRIYLLECPFFCAGGMKGVPHPSVRQQRVALVLDGENCLDRLYGGYFPNWVCGGQVRQQLLSTLSSNFRKHRSPIYDTIHYTACLWEKKVSPKFTLTWDHRQNCRIGQPSTKKWFLGPDKYGPCHKSKEKLGEIRSLLVTLPGTLWVQKIFYLH